MTIMEADLGATTEPRMTEIDAPMSLPLTCPLTTSENWMRTNGKSQISRGYRCLTKPKTNEELCQQMLPMAWCFSTPTLGVTDATPISVPLCIYLCTTVTVLANWKCAH